MSAEKLTGGLAYKWLTEVTLRLRALEGRNRVIEERGKVEANENVAYEVIKTEPKVRDCNWESFKNRYSRDHCTFAIETLLAGDDLDDEMEQEQLIANIMLSVNYLVSLLKKGWQNVGSLVIKASMSPPRRLY